MRPATLTRTPATRAPLDMARAAAEQPLGGNANDGGRATKMWGSRALTEANNYVCGAGDAKDSHDRCTPLPQQHMARNCASRRRHLEPVATHLRATARGDLRRATATATCKPPTRMTE